ncbi:MAG: NifB/NifX family molybdenum-iron cluster-binding protein [Chitinispirillaceae bacterium]|nr:NifB/NifX family molybdenum-iron cluster-binding protein [Chitinispirillaceae bacterium]
MRIVLPVSGTYVATVFDFADKLMVVDITKMTISEKRVLSISRSLPSITVARLRELKTNTLICGAISNPLAAMVWHSGIEVVHGITGEVDAVVSAFLRGQLAQPRYLLPGTGHGGECGWWQGNSRRFRGGHSRM